MKIGDGEKNEKENMTNKVHLHFAFAEQHVVAATGDELGGEGFSLAERPHKHLDGQNTVHCGAVPKLKIKQK